jgi:nucleoside-diphosphate-sugar epimerase
VARELTQRGLAWRGAARAGADLSGMPAATHGFSRINDLGPDTDWRAALADVGTVIHLAARAHAAATPVELQRVNVAGARALAEQARTSGTQRFVFVSSVKAMGEETPPGQAWTESQPCAPQDAYGRSKLEAERAVQAAATGMEAVVLRFPLVYGPRVRGNLLRLLHVIRSGRPLPFGAVQNSRSLLGARNAADALILAATHPNAAGGLFLARDVNLSTPELLVEMGAALGRAPRLWSWPPALLALSPFARPALRRLTRSLRLDDTRLRTNLGWSPPFTPRAAMMEMAQDFLAAPPRS